MTNSQAVGAGASAAPAGLLGLMTPSARPAALSRETRREILDEVARVVSDKFSPDQLRRPTDAIRESVQALAGQATAAAVRRRGLTSVPYVEEQKLAGEITRRLVGLGFLDLLLPPARRDSTA